ncbi:MAG: polysaccharide biosynthesis tyrosine autokinase, partial [Candidatus Neomarinimicrobiota bacterium]
MSEKVNFTKEFQELSFRDYYFLFRIHFKKILFFILIGVTVGVYNMLITPPSFTATATIVVREKPGANVVMDLTGNRERHRIENDLQLIKSRNVAKATIEKLWSIKKNNLDLFGSYPFYPRGKRLRTFIKEMISFGLYDPNYDVAKRYEEEYSDAIGERFASSLIKKINVSPRSNSDIIDISYTSVWPEEAKLIINTIADVYKDFDQRLSSKDASSSVLFLENLVIDLERNLNKSEEELTLFKKQERMYDLDGYALDITNQIGAVESNIYSTKSELNIKKEKYSILKSKLSQDEKNLAEKILNTIDAQLISLRNELGLLEGQLIQNIALYGQEHNAIKSINNKIDALKIQLNKKVNELTKQGILIQDPIKSRQAIISELISLESEITVLELSIKQSQELLKIFNDKLSGLPLKQLEFSRLQRNNIVLNQNYNLLRQKLEEAKINVASQVGKVQIVDYARVPVQSGINQNSKIISGLFFGFIVGILFIIIIELIDNTVKTNFDIEKNSLTVLGVIPAIGKEDSSAKNRISRLFKPMFVGQSSKVAIKRRLITKEDPRSPVSEAYRSLRTSMLYTGIDKMTKSILVSSAGPGEGKTTTVANMAITYANLGKKTLLVDTDLRRPVVHKIMNLDKEPGITNYLAGNINDFNELIRETDIDNLYAVTSGIIPPNPSELLGSKRMADLIDSLEKDWDMILFDSPPLVAVTDATMVSKAIDCIIIVVKVGQTDKKAFEHTIQSLRNVNAPIEGVVLNAVSHKNSYGSYYYYYQYYNYYGNENDND